MDSSKDLNDPTQNKNGADNIDNLKETSGQASLSPSNNTDLSNANSVSPGSHELVQPATTSSVNPGNSVINNNLNSSSGLNPEPTKKKGFKKLGIVPIVAIIAVLVMSAGAAAYLGVIKPNNPDNLWESALSNSAKGMEKIAEYQKNVTASEGMKFSGNFNIGATDLSADGNFEGKTYKSDSEIKADIGAIGGRLNIELKTDKPENANNPDIYFKLQGLDSFSAILGAADPSVQALVGQINNQWYVIDHTLLDQASSEATGTELSSNLTPEEINKISDTLIQTTNEYALSSDPTKALINKTENVGWEEKDGRTVYHYKVSLNKENFKAYLNSNKEKFKQLNIKSLEGTDAIFEELVKSVDEIKQEEANADVWVDKETRLLRTIRFSDKDNQETYAEFSINYNGSGDVLPLQAKVVSNEEGSKGELVANLSLDTKSNSVSADLSFKDDNSTSAKFEIKAEPNNEQLDVTPPADAKYFYELMGLFGMTEQGTPTGSVINPLTETLGVFDIRQP